ncbi:MAG: 1-acyl-sn-glycerol-3-phosphate acyltransferase [Oscillospiraceae bacterium]|nr:1-acyl-sn-glycerol-3-phosphate acyltransferase [Oscillospiraceae bacterium]
MAFRQQAGRKAPKNTVQPVNGFLMNVLYYGARFYLFLCGVRIRTVNKVGRPEKPSIVLCNHGSFIDFIYAAALLRRDKPHFIVARLYFYHKLLGWLLRKVGAFPKSMFAMDLESTKNSLTVLKKGEILAMMPEARLSTAGRFEDIQSGTYSFIKKSGVTVYTVKIGGDYLADPKWGKGFRRGAVADAELDILFTAEQVKELSLEQLKQGIEQRLFFDEFQWLQQHPDIHYRSPRIAEGLENILTVCPACGGKYTLTTDGNAVSCEHCGALTTMDDRYCFAKDFRFENPGRWYDWQLALLKKEIAETENFTLRSKVELRLPGDGSSLTRHGGHGICTLNREGLTYAGTKDGETVELHFSLGRIYRLLFGAGENFEIYDGTQILYFVPEEKRSAVDWYMASMLLYDMTAEAEE